MCVGKARVRVFWYVSLFTSIIFYRYSISPAEIRSSSSCNTCLRLQDERLKWVDNKQPAKKAKIDIDGVRHEARITSGASTYCDQECVAFPRVGWMSCPAQVIDGNSVCLP